MEKENIVVINIVWEEIDFDFAEFKKWNSKSDYGLYQIYGHHPAYGDNSLLYIGQAAAQTFAQRLNDRWEFIESTARPKKVCLGRITYNIHEGTSVKLTQDEWKKIIDISERLLIKTHTPAFNSHLDKSLNKNTDDDYLIINWGDYNRLLPEISTLRMSWKFWTFEKPYSQE